MRVFASTTDDVCANLALEEALLDQAGGGAEPVLLFTANAPAVVLGRNQNPWREVRLDRAGARGVRLARRISGGGTVYHDAGNLNYSVILPRAAYQRDRIFHAVLEGLATCGVRASRSGAHSLVTDGRKFSGSAFCFRREGALHHGTLLVRADLSQLADVLGPTVEGMDTRATASVPAVVCNLGDVIPALDFARLQQALADALARELGSPAWPWAPDAVLGEAARGLVARNRSRAWLLDETPAWTIPFPGLDTPEGWLRIEQGRLAACGADVPAGAVLRGAAWDRVALAERLPAVPARARPAWYALLNSPCLPDFRPFGIGSAWLPGMQVEESPE